MENNVIVLSAKDSKKNDTQAIFIFMTLMFDDLVQKVSDLGMTWFSL